MGEKFSAPEFSSALATLSILVRSSEIDNDSDDEIDEDEKENENRLEYNLNDNPLAIPGTKLCCDSEEFIFLQRDVNIKFKKKKPKTTNIYLFIFLDFLTFFYKLKS